MWKCFWSKRGWTRTPNHWIPHSSLQVSVLWRCSFSFPYCNLNCNSPPSFEPSSRHKRNTTRGDSSLLSFDFSSRFKDVFRIVHNPKSKNKKKSPRWCLFCVLGVLLIFSQFKKKKRKIKRFFMYTLSSQLTYTLYSMYGIIYVKMEVCLHLQQQTTTFHK